MKEDQNITFMKSCKEENLVPTFTKVNLSINSRSYKLRYEISKLIIQTELENKHHEKRKLRTEILSIGIEL